MTAKNVDWKKVEQQFCSGVVPIAEIARQAGVVEGTIRHRAKSNGWKKSLTASVRARTADKLTAAIAGASGITGQITNPLRAGTERTPEEDEQIIEQAALTQVAVVREHSASIRHGLNITARMMHELDISTTKNDELMDLLNSEKDDKKRYGAIRAVSLPARAAVMRDLAQAARVWINLERQAFRISDDRTKETASAVNDMTEEELDASIMEDLLALGMIEAPKAIAAPVAKAKGVAPKKD